MSELGINIQEIDNSENTTAARVLGVDGQNVAKLFPISALKGAKGAGIVQIVSTSPHTSESGAANEYQIIFDGGIAPFTFVINNGDKGETGEGFAIARLYNTIAAMTGDTNPVAAGRLVAVVTDDVADVYMRAPEQTATGDNQQGYKFICHFDEAAVIRGEKGDKGDKGDAPTFEIGTIQTIEFGEPAEVTITRGTNADYALNLKLPQGQPGMTGNPGRSIDSVDFTPIEGGRRLTIIYNDTAVTADIMDGADGDSIDDEHTAANTTWSSEKLAPKFDWVAEKMQKELGDEALGKYNVETAVSGNSFYADQQANTTMVVTVRLTFNGSRVAADSVPAGWVQISENGSPAYQKQITGTSGTIPAQAFQHTPSSGKYAGIVVTKSSAAKSIAAIYPTYIGLVTDNDINGVNLTETVAALAATQMAGINGRLTTNIANRKTNIPNNGGVAAWLWIITHNSASADSPVGSLLKTPQYGISFTSPDGVAMSNYKVYISQNSVAPAGSYDNTTLTINI